MLNIASKVFINLRVKPDCLSSLWSIDDRISVNLCKKVILESVFPDDGSIDTDLQLGRLLGILVNYARAREEHGSERIAVISGIGTRGYYRRLGYELEGAYMVMEL